MIRRSTLPVFVVVLFVQLAAAPSSFSQEPLDLFQDLPELDANFLRLGAWNLRHIDLDGDLGTAAFLKGNNRNEDFAILTSTFAKAIKDLSLDLVAIVEVQPRAGEPNRLHQIRDHLSSGGAAWQSDQTAIEYDNPSDPFGNLQLGLLWNSAKVTVDPGADTLLGDLRQPRNASGTLTEKTTRAPWLVPVKVGTFSFDLMVLHLKSGGQPPIEDEVKAIEGYIKTRQSAANPKHLVVCGDWNLRPDFADGRARLQRMQVPVTAGHLMKVLTVELIPPDLKGWETIGFTDSSSPIAGLLPFTHFNKPSTDTFLDHIAISRTFDEIFDHPVEVRTRDGRIDLSPGILIARPLIPEDDYNKLTDHLPVVMVLRVTGGDAPPPLPAGLRIASAIPNPFGDDTQKEEVTIKNGGTMTISLSGWKIGDSTASQFWVLDAADGDVTPGASRTVSRKGRDMSLNNGGDTIRLVDPAGNVVDTQSYGASGSGKVWTFGE